jgi:hypothetical protein
MMRGLLRWGGLSMVGTTMVLVLAACSSDPAARVTSPAGPSSTPAATAGQPQPYRLYTHCGIDEARIGNRYFEAVHPLGVRLANPPPGWGNPYQQGTMTLLSPTKAVFRDLAGHQVQFRLRPGATAFKRLCS